MWNTDQAKEVATQVLIEYLGVAAQFVVDDAIDRANASANFSHLSEDARLRTFLIHLMGDLPPGLPNEVIRSTIYAKYNKR